MKWVQISKGLQGQGLSGLIFDTIDHSRKAKALEEENGKIKALFSRT